MSDGMYRLLGADVYRGRFFDIIMGEKADASNETGDEIALRVMKNAGLTFEE